MSYTAADLKNLMTAEDDLIVDQTGGYIISPRIIASWNLLPVSNSLNITSRSALMRLNCLADLFYFAVTVLKKTKFQLNPDLSQNLHYMMCGCVMKDGLKEVIEIPRDHFKSSVFSECFAIWRALPFSARDEDLFSHLGMPPLYLEWMRRAHNQDIRILLVSETIENAKKLGTKIKSHYENNELFRNLFPEIVPDSTCVWTDASLHQKRTKSGRQHGEGTFDFIGVGGALQSRHYDMPIEDDLVGKKALGSEAHMNTTIEYHQLLVGALDSQTGNGGRDNDEIVVGNRWSYKDLNSHIRETETYFNFITHSALGGCCPLHPYGIPIFPEAFTREKLARWKARLGSYLFSCQFLNFPINPEQCKFENKNLQYYRFVRDTEAGLAATTGGVNNYSHLTGIERLQAAAKQKTYRPVIRHDVREGVVERDIFPRTLDRYIIADPNHAGKKGRCRNAITVTGLSQSPRRIYLLDVWAESSSPDKFVEQLFLKAMAWRCNKIHLETVAAQKYLKYHLEYYIKENKARVPEIAGIQIVDLKYDNAENAKQMRIESLAPIFERGEFWVNKVGMTEFHEEYEAYGNKNGLKDVLDTLGYGPTIWKFNDLDDREMASVVSQRQARFERAMRGAVGLR